MITILSLALLSAGHAQLQDSSDIDKQPNGFVREGEDSLVPEKVALDEIKPSFRYKEASHVANGVALRNRSAGTIHLRGVPLKSKILQSLLYWNFSDGDQRGASTKPILFDGNVIIGRKTADNIDPCWGMNGNHTYVADVTAYTNQSGGPNQDYEVTTLFNSGTSTTGQNPWSPYEFQKVRLEGATLIVVYANETTSGELYIYDDLSGSTFFGNATFGLVTPALTQLSGLLTMAGADGQRGFGHDNFASNELTFFEGNQIAGPPEASSDWDGSDGWPLPQLWDTHTHHVQWRDDVAVSKLEYRSNNGDCLVPAAFVLDVN